MSRLADIQASIDQMASARTPRGLQSLVYDVAVEMGFDNVTLYHHVDLSGASPSYHHMTRGDLIGLTTCSETWSEHYRDNDLVAIDPRVLASRCTAAPFQTEEMGKLIQVTAAQRGVVERQARANIGDGFTIPVHFPGEPTGSCTFSMRRGRSLPTRNLGMASWVGTSAFQAARAILRAARERPSAAVPKVRLTDRQVQCTLLVGRGLCEGEIATRLGISAETVKQHLKDARQAYGVAKSIQLVTHSLQDGRFSLRDLLAEKGSELH